MQNKPLSHDRIGRTRIARRQRGLRPVVLWLPDVNDAAYRAQLAEECRSLAHLSDEENAIVDDFIAIAADNQEWR